jgi:hypothetical protein
VRWALLPLALLLAVAGLIYGGVAFMSRLSEAAASLRVDGPATVAATTAQAGAPTGRRRADPMAASGVPRPEWSPGSDVEVPSDWEDSSPAANEQRVLKSRKALETVDPREFLRQAPTSK